MYYNAVFRNASMHGSFSTQGLSNCLEAAAHDKSTCFCMIYELRSTGSNKA